jgi:iron complex transport system substrate-binding protein
MNLKSQISNLKKGGSKIQDPRSKKNGSLLANSLIIFVVFIISGCSDPRVPESPRPRVSDTALAPTRGRTDAPTRIVSLAPSITEVLFALDLGDRVAGVTRYCDFPPEVVGRPVVGGYFDVNYEMLMSLESDLIILLAEHQEAIVRLEELGLPTLAVNHSRVEGILDSINIIADRCGAKGNGETLRLTLESRVRQVQEGFSLPGSHATTLPRPRILVAVGRLMDKGSGGEIFISGRDGFYDDLIAMAGGVNAYREETLKFPAVSDEGLVRLDPDIILEMVPDLAGEADRQTLMDLWHAKSGVRAVREGRVHILGEDYVVVPGPRFVDLLEEMAGIIEEGRRNRE